MVVRGQGLQRIRVTARGPASAHAQDRERHRRAAGFSKLSQRTTIRCMISLLRQSRKKMYGDREHFVCRSGGEMERRRLFALGTVQTGGVSWLHDSACLSTCANIKLLRGVGVGGQRAWLSC